MDVTELARRSSFSYISFGISSIALIFTLAIGSSIAALAAGTSQSTPNTSANSAVKFITIGFIPGENPQELQANGEALAQLLHSKIGMPVKIYVSKDYSGLIEAMRTKKIDFAFFSAMTFVFAEKMAGAKVLLKKIWSGPYYYSTILTRGDQNLTKLSQLKGKRLAFVDQKSTSGFLYPQVYFKKNNVDPNLFFKSTVFSGNHPESIRLLRNGDVDAAAVFSNDSKGADTAWDRFASKDEPSKVSKTGVRPRSIWVSEPIPNDPFCVRQDFYDANPRVATDLMFALRDLDDDVSGGAKFKKLLNITGLMLATSQQYDSVRELVKDLDLKLDGN